MINNNQVSGLIYFGSPIYSVEIPELVNETNKICDKYIKNAKEKNIKVIKEREKRFNKKIGDHGLSNQSEFLINETKLDKLKNYIGEISWKILNEIGYDLTNYELFFTELWVQEFSEKGGGHHEGHIHSDNHMSGFYFLKCSDKTSYPIFHDPRIAKIMSQLPLKNENEITFGSDKIHLYPTPGTLVFFPAYLEHQFTVDYGIEPFRFIHFNLQAVRKIITNSINK